MFPCALNRQIRLTHILSLPFRRLHADRLRFFHHIRQDRLFRHCVAQNQNRFSFVSYISRSVHNTPCLNNESSRVRVTFVTTDGKRHETSGKVGDSLLDVVVDKNVPLDGYGACEGTLACSTCHVILKQEDFDRLPNKPADEELDMLDLAVDLSDTSRLGCQITLTKDLDGLEVTVPSGIRDVRTL